MNLYFWAKELLHRKSGGKAGALALLPLTLLSFLWSTGQKLRRFLYSVSILPSSAAPVPVICVGNITLGGTGKTPIVEEVCRILENEKVVPAVISRGYGGKLKGDYMVVSDGETIFADPKEAGDEPVLLARRLKAEKIGVVVAPRRALAAQKAVEELGAAVLVMDDGFGHLALKRELNIVVIDATRPFGNGFCLPRGTLREPMGALREAGAFVFTRTGGLGDNYLATVEQKIRKFNENAPILKAFHVPDSLTDGATGEKAPLEWLSGRRVVAFAGIGNPGAFFTTVREVGGVITEEVSFPDHFDFTGQEIGKLLKFARLTGAEALVTTEKDLERLKGFLPLETPLYSLNIKMEFASGDRQRLAKIVTGVVRGFRGP